MDNEAGMEHISRLTTKNVDVLLIVADASRRAVQAALRIHQLSKDLNIGVGRSCLVINQSKSEPTDAVYDMISQNGLELGGIIPEDSAVYEYDADGRPTVDIPEDNPAVQAAFAIFDKFVT
jgi:CO dehydrogenase maturation factor